MAVIDLGNGDKLRTFPPPPENFDPLNASAAALAMHGFPARPEEPALRALLEQRYARMKGPFRVVEPATAPPPTTRRHSARNIFGPTPAYSIIPVPMGGAGIYDPNMKVLTWVTADLTLPSITVPAGDPPLSSVGWAAGVALGSSIGNATTTPFLFLGVQAVFLNSPADIVYQVMTYDDFPPTSLGLSAGDSCSLLLCAVTLPNGELWVSYYLTSQGPQATVLFTQQWGIGPSAVSLSGGTQMTQAGWVTTLPQYFPGQYTELANFGQFTFTNAMAGPGDPYTRPTTDTPGLNAPGGPFSMTIGMTTVAKCNVPNSGEIQITYTGP
jgi:hypothetical protein